MPKSSESKTSKILTSVLLFCYFGIIIIPQGVRPIPIQLSLLLLPIVLITLVVFGFRGGIGLWRERTNKELPNPQNKYYVWLASLGIAWFIISIMLGNSTYYNYSHMKFVSETWKNSAWNDGSFFQLSTRERMFDDLTNNVLPGISKTEMLDLLGKPDEQRDIAGEEAFIYYYRVAGMDTEFADLPECLIITFDDKDFMKDHSTSICG